MDADGAAQVVDNLTADLDFIDLKPDEVTRALKEAKQRGVRGGRVHDFLHAVAAEKCRVKDLLTADENDFEHLLDTVSVEQV